jgi:hypothetical protein
LSADANQDYAGNNQVAGNWISFTRFDGRYWAEVLNTNRLWSSQNNGKLDRMLLYLHWPFDRSYWYANYPGMLVSFVNYTSDGVAISSVTRPVKGIDVSWFTADQGLVDGTDLDGLDALVLSFDEVDTTGVTQYTASTFYKGVVIGNLINYSPDILRDGTYVDDLVVFTDSADIGGSAASAISGQIVSATTVVGTRYLNVTFSKIRQGAAFNLSQFAYFGENSMVSVYLISSNQSVIIEMSAVYTQEMIGSDSIVFVGVYDSVSNFVVNGVTPWKLVPVSPAIGQAPSIATTQIANVGNFSTERTITVLFQTPVNSTTVTASAFTIQSENPFFTAADISNVSVADDGLSATVQFTSSCTSDLCEDTSGSFSVAATGITDRYRNKMILSSQPFAVDVVPPQIKKVVALGPNTLLIMLTESSYVVNGNLASFITPRATACEQSNKTIIVATYTTDVSGSMFRFVAGGGVTDASGNPPTTSDFAAVKAESTVSPTCDSLDDLPGGTYTAVLVSSIISGAVILTYAVLGARYWYRVRRYGKARAQAATDNKYMALPVTET